MAWCPKFAMYRSTVVSARRRNLYYTDESVELVETIEKAATLVYSTDSGIFLSPKDVPKSGGASPFFGTSFKRKSLKTGF